MEAALYAWFLKIRRRHLPVSGAMLKEKAKHFAGILKESRNFNNSQGWLQKFKKKIWTFTKNFWEKAFFKC
jgi:hypothetical protein